MDVLNTLTTATRASEPSGSAPIDAASTSKESGKSFEDTLQSVYDAAVVAAAEMVPVVFTPTTGPVSTNTSVSSSLSPGAASKGSSLPDAAPTAPATPVEPKGTGLSLSLDAAVSATAGPVASDSRAAGEPGAGIPAAGATALVAVTEGVRPANTDTADEETKDDSSDIGDSSNPSVSAEPVDAPNGFSPASQKENLRGNSVASTAASSVPTTIAEQRVNASSQGSLELDAVRAMWSEVDLSRAKNRIEASVVTAHGEVQVTARTVKGETRVAVVAPSAVVFAAGVGVEDRVRKDLLSVGIDVADIQFTNSETSPKRDHHGHNNNEKEDQDAQ